MTIIIIIIITIIITIIIKIIITHSQQWHEHNADKGKTNLNEILTRPCTQGELVARGLLLLC